jgi:hypothetical protein
MIFFSTNFRFLSHYQNTKNTYYSKNKNSLFPRIKNTCNTIFFTAGHVKARLFITRVFTTSKSSWLADFLSGVCSGMRHSESMTTTIKILYCALRYGTYSELRAFRDVIDF